MKKVCLLLIVLVMILSGCTEIPQTEDQSHQSKKIKVIIHIDDQTGRFHYFGISINKTHPDPNTLMYHRINWMKKTTAPFLLDKGSEYRIDLSPSIDDPIQAMKNGTKLKEASKHNASAETNERDFPIRKYITPTKNNQVIQFVVE